MNLESFNSENFIKLDKGQMGKLVGGACSCYTMSGSGTIKETKVSNDVVVDNWSDDGKHLGSTTSWKASGGDLSTSQINERIEGLEKC